MAAYESVETAAASGGIPLIGKKVYDTQSESWKFIQGMCAMVYANVGWVPASNQYPLPVVFSDASITIHTADGIPIEVSGEVAATQSGDWSVRLLDGNGEIIPGATSTPSSGSRGIIVRTVGPSDQGDSNQDPLEGWSSRLTDGLAYIGSTIIDEAHCIDVRERFEVPETFLEDSLTNSPVLVNSGATELRFMTIENPGANKAYLQIFDAADDSSVSLGSDDPKMSFVIPAGGAYELPLIPLKFASGLVIAATTTPKGALEPTSDLIVNAAFL